MSACPEVLCPPLVNPSNGLVTFESLLVDSVATYSCDLEFLLIGMEQRTCLHPSGIWSGSEPSCQSTFGCVSVAKYKKSFGGFFYFYFFIL